ncbi:MAG: ABC transporter ATP-binding protein [Pseudomonadota bacterium]
MSVIKVTELRKSFFSDFLRKETEVLKGVSFEIKKGGITGFLGGNGAGKTTTMKCLLDLSFPTSGRVEYFDGLALSPEVKKRIGFLPEHPYFYDYLTGIEFLEFYGQLSSKMPKVQMREKIEGLLKRVDLWHAKDRKLRGFSKGMKQKIGLAQALIHDPELVILDEPMSGLDPDGRQAMSEIIQEIAKKGTSVFFSSHLLHDVERLCDDLVILAKGEVVYQGTTHQFLDRVQQGYSMVYEMSGERKTVTLDTVELVQTEMKRVSQEGAIILEMKPARMSLEEAFVEIALR